MAKIEDWSNEPEGALVEWLQARLEGREDVNHKLKVVLAKCGYKRRSEQRLLRIRQALDQAQIYTRPQIDVEPLTGDDKVWFSHRPYEDWEDGVVFRNEKELAEAVARYLRCIPEFEDFTDPEIEYRIPGSRFRVDLLFRDLWGDYVVCELKNNDGGHGVGGQLFTYLEALEPLAIKEGRSVRGLIITTEPNHRREEMIAREATALGYPVEWFVLTLKASAALRVTSDAGWE